jgi:hypothetical protein
VIVVIISITGVANYLFIVGPNLDEVMLSTYGELLFLKVLLFAGMIVLATLNRFHLSPLLERSVRNGDYAVAVNALPHTIHHRHAHGFHRAWFSPLVLPFSSHFPLVQTPSGVWRPPRT